MDAVLSQYVFTRGLSAPARAWLARPFPARARHRLLIYYNPMAISFAQVHPFLAWSRTLADTYGTVVRAVPVDRFEASAGTREADTVIFGPWFTEDPDKLSRRLEALRRAQPSCRIAFLDSFAPTDLRLGAAVEPHVDWYLKKSLFHDERLYLRAYRGDTNLTEYYGDLYGIEEAPVDWGTPEAIFPKLRLSPNFLTAPQFLDHFPPGKCPPQEGRDLDMQTRLGRKGSPWYTAMRGDALARAEAIDGITRSPPERISYAAYMEEMRRSRLCFSPFGYGELCWRDIEAFQTGSVLIKPDMSHLKTLPDLYEPGVTYLPVKWDFSDLEEVVRRALADPDLRQRIATEAYDRCATYLQDGTRFAADMRFLFEPET